MTRRHRRIPDPRSRDTVTKRQSRIGGERRIDSRNRTGLDKPFRSETAFPSSGLSSRPRSSGHGEEGPRGMRTGLPIYSERHRKTKTA